MKIKEPGFKFDKDKCIQCHGCETACKTWNSIETGIRLRKVLNIWEGSFPEVRSSSLSISCQHCAEPACVEACKSNAIIKNENGTVSVIQEKCTGCRACFSACPFNVPQFNSENIMQLCTVCGPVPPCVRTCPTGALEIKNMSFDEKKKQEKILLQELEK